MKYRMVQANDSTTLDREVNDLMVLGFRPHGGIAVAYNPQTVHPNGNVNWEFPIFAQAMVHDDLEP